MKFTDFYEAYTFLEGHYYFENKRFKRQQPDFQESLNFTIVKVNPETKEIDEDETKNTETNIWLECGPFCEENNCFTHSSGDERQQAKYRFLDRFGPWIDALMLAIARPGASHPRPDPAATARTAR